MTRRFGKLILQRRAAMAVTSNDDEALKFGVGNMITSAFDGRLQGDMMRILFDPLPPSTSHIHIYGEKKNKKKFEEVQRR
jgi:hypothetical protein